MFDPTTGALIITPDRDLKIRKALRREARRIAFGLRLRKPLFEIKYFVLKARYAFLKLRRNVARDAAKLISRRHRRLLALLASVGRREPSA